MTCIPQRLYLKEDHPEEVSKILIILDSVCLDSDYHFGIYIEEICHERRITNQCEQSWFHCYQGKEEPIMRRPYNYWKWDDDGNMNMLFLRKTFGIFKHISVKATPMGAWQAYLLCISKAILPFSGTLYYTKRKLIFTDKQLKDRYLSHSSHHTQVPVPVTKPVTKPACYIEKTFFPSK